MSNIDNIKNINEIHSIETTYGYIKKEDIPYVVAESFKNKIEKAFLFYSIIAIVLIVVVYITYSYEYKDNLKNEMQKSKLLNNRILQKIPTEIKVRKLNIYNPDEIVNLENIILLSSNNNIIDVDLERNYFVNKFHIGNGLLYTIDFGKDILIKEMVLVQPLKEMVYPTPIIYIDCYDSNDNNIWNYGGILQNKKDNTIIITKLI